MRLQPGDAGANPLGMPTRVGEHKRADGGRRGEGAAGEVTFPMTGGGAFREETSRQGAQRLVER